MHYLYNPFSYWRVAATAPLSEVEEQRNLQEEKEEESFISHFVQLQLSGSAEERNSVFFPNEVYDHILRHLNPEDLKTNAFFVSHDFNAISKRKLGLKNWLYMPNDNLEKLTEIFNQWQPKKINFNGMTDKGARVNQLLRNVDKRHQIEQVNISSVLYTRDELRELALLLPNITHLFLMQPEIILNELANRQDNEDHFLSAEAFINIVLAVLRANPHSWRFLPEEVKGSFEWMLKAMDIDKAAFQQIAPELRSNSGFMLKAILKNFQAIKMADKNLLNKEEFILKALELAKPLVLPHYLHHEEKMAEVEKEIAYRTRFILQYAANELKDDPEFIEQANAIHPSAIKAASNAVKKNEEFLKAQILKDKAMLAEIPPKLRNQAAFMLWAIERHTAAIDYISERLQADFDFMLRAVGLTNHAIEKIPPHLANDPNFIRQAIRCNPLAIRAASAEIKNDRQFMLEAISKAEFIAVECLSAELREDTQFMEEVDRQLEMFGLKREPTKTFWRLLF